MITAAHDIDLSLISGFQSGIKPDPIITVSQWADEKRILPATAAESGKYKTSRTPYAKEIMDKLSVIDPAQKIIVKKGAQVGFTEIGNNWVGYCIDVSPASFLYIMPTDGEMKKTSKQRIEKMIEATPELRAKVAKSKARDSGNTLLYKEFTGGFISMVGANSPVGLASAAIRNVYGDEIDRYPLSVGGEGSAISLADARTSTYGSRKKIFLTSTPTKKALSQIDAEFEKTGQRYYHVPCPFCNHYQVLEFDHLKYEVGKYTDTKYQCVNCNALIEERFKTRMLAAGIWIPKFPEKEDGYLYGYHISAMYSPYGMFSWRQMAQEYEESRNDTAKKIAFVNTRMGECYEEEQGEKPDWESIFDRAEDYELNKPFASVVFITAGVDVQADRIELEIVGWMKGKRSQSLDYIVLLGDTSQDDVWRELDTYLDKTWIRQGDNALLPLRLMAVDTGYNTTKVYEFAKKHSISRVIPVKGRERQETYVAAPKAIDIMKSGKKIGKTKVFNVGVSMIKAEIYGNLRKRINVEDGNIPEGFCHFPKREPSYFRGITAEEIIIIENRRGYPESIWKKKYKRNEPLDCRVYARAAAYMVGMDKWTDEKWNHEINNVQVFEPKQQKAQPAMQQKTKPPRKSIWDRN